MVTQAGPGMELGVSPCLRCGFSLDLGQWWIQVLLESSVLVALTARLSGASGLMLLFFFFLFAFPHCLLSEPPVHETWLLLGEGNPMCVAMSSVLWLDKQRKGIAHLVTGPGRCQGGTPGWEAPVGQVCFSCDTQDSWASGGSAGEGSVEGTRWC